MTSENEQTPKNGFLGDPKKGEKKLALELYRILNIAYQPQKKHTLESLL